MHLLSAYDLHKAFLKGEYSAQSITENFLNRIEKYDDQLGSFLSVLSDRALAKAKMLDSQRSQGKKMGKLAGVPIAIKDNIHIQGEITTCASKFLVNYRAPFDATVVRLLEDEGAILIGKTNLDEFSMGSSTENSALKRTSNPWDLNCCPGGSSGGSAAAVSARLAPLSLGSDTGGSIRQPASFCGIVGFKPTYGRVSRYGLVAFGSSLDQIGPLATNCRDAALVMEVIGSHCNKDSTSLKMAPEGYTEKLSNDLQGVKIGVPWEFLEGLCSDGRRVFDESIALFKELGAQIVPVDLSILKHSLAVYYILATAEASTNLARFDGIRYGVRSPEAKTLEQVYEFSRREGFGAEVKRRILLGTYVLSAGYKDAFYNKAQKMRTLILESYAKAFSQCDLVATPVSPIPAFERGTIKSPLQMYLEDIYTIGVNLGGVPAISIPSGFCRESHPLPIGLQLVGAQKQDAKVLSVAHAFEGAARHNTIPPFIQS